MTSQTLTEHLLQAFDPLLLIDGDGTVVWRNSATDRFFRLPASSNPNELVSYFSPAVIRQIYNAEQYALIPLKLIVGDNNTVEQILIILETAGGNLDSELRLLALKTPIASHEPIGRYDEFLATVTHDLKNPIGAVHGYADVLLDTPAGDGMNEKQRDIASRIRSTASKIIELIRNYQYLSRVKAESFGILISSEPQSADLRTTLQSVIDYTWRESAESPILVVNFQTPRINVALERIHLERILANLLSNALKYTPARKKVTVHAATENNFAVFRINNEGEPIPASELPTLFEVFRRGSNRGTKSGHGIGLFIVKSIVDRAHGEILVESDANNGTTFTLRLPNG